MKDVQEKQPRTVVTSDSENSTKIRPDEALPHKRKKFRKFRAYNTGMWNGPRRENTEQFRRQDDLHRYDAISSKFGLTDYQKARGRKMIDNIGFERFSVDEAAFGICMVVANEDAIATEDGEHPLRHYPNPGGVTYVSDEEFEEMAESLGIPESRQCGLYHQIRSWMRR